MKELKNKWLGALMVLIVIGTTFSTSCKKDDNKDQGADYVGKWNSDTVVTPAQTGDHKDVLTLTQSTFDDLIQTQNSSGTWVNSIQVKGTMTVTANVMNVHVAEIGVSAMDASGKFTGEMTSYKEGSLFFGIIMAQIGQNADFKSEYTVSGNKLTLKTDMNNNGNYNDPNETTQYTRQ